MFWRKSDDAPPTDDASPKPDAPPQGDDLTDAALDTISIVLRALADNDVDINERKLLNDWSQHILTQSPTPNTGRMLGAGRRDWPGLRSAITNLIRDRAQRSRRALDDMREAMNAVTRSVYRAVSEDRAGNTQARIELQNLTVAVEEKSPEEIRRCAIRAVSSLSELLDQNDSAWTDRLLEINERAERREGRLVVAEKEGQTDALTALTNRRGFDQHLNKALEAARSIGDQSTLILFDLDHFKQLNDQHGHVAGDAVLRAFATELALCFPRCGDCVARYGGEEFAVILRRSNATDGLRLAERCLERVRRLQIPIGTRVVGLTASAGITEIATHESAAAVITRADAALYTAKNGGRNRAVRQ